jgi:hypothetical protein
MKEVGTGGYYTTESFVLTVLLGELHQMRLCCVWNVAKKEEDRSVILKCKLEKQKCEILNITGSNVKLWC